MKAKNGLDHRGPMGDSLKGETKTDNKASLLPTEGEVKKSAEKRTIAIRRTSDQVRKKAWPSLKERKKTSQ